MAVLTDDEIARELLSDLTPRCEIAWGWAPASKACPRDAVALVAFVNGHQCVVSRMACRDCVDRMKKNGRFVRYMKVL